MHATSDSLAPVRLQDYRPPDFSIDRVELEFELDAERTLVRSRLHVRRRNAAATALVLDGRGLETLSVAIDGEALSANAYHIDGDRLTLPDCSDAFVLDTVTAIRPRGNSSGEGLFQIKGQLATQCEAEGFRRLTWFLDRPDVLATYTVTLHGSKAAYPVLLSNGELQAKGEHDDGRHWTRWHDPHPKPCYIFAVMAGTWSCLRDEYVTRSGRRIALGIYADAALVEQCRFAMGALQRALRWDEDVFGFEYDLDTYNIVALTDYVGAMENKGLNLFEAHGIAADPETSTDDDYLLIERILAHEVFHNWTGNRVTCRDWFQLSIKEGLTRLRDQLFSADMGLAGYKRIDQVKALRRNQFPEDTGPAAHAVQPKQYMEIRNFYTGTVYDKGAEVVRMLLRLLGRERFVAAVTEYVRRFDLQAVTKDDFLEVLCEVGGRDLEQFTRWYDQPGRPTLVAEGAYDAANRSYEVRLQQRAPVLAHLTRAADAPPLHIPVEIGLIGNLGRVLSTRLHGAADARDSHVLELTTREARFRFEAVDEPATPSLLRGFTAPVTLQSDLSDAALAHLMAYDRDDFARWDAAQQLGVASIRQTATAWRAGAPLALPAAYADAFGVALTDRATDAAVLAEILRVPDEPVLSDGLARIDLDAHAAARAFVCRALAERYRGPLLAAYSSLANAGGYRFTEAQIGRRKLRNVCLEHLVASGDDDMRTLCLQQVLNAGNMTDAFDALSFLAQVDCTQRVDALEVFYARWQQHDRVIDKWFSVQALARMPGAVHAIAKLQQHPAMNPRNRPRGMAFYGSFFRQNRVAFHDPSGKGYEMLADRLIFLDRLSAGVSYWFMPQILQWRRYDDARQGLMRRALERVAAHPGLSRSLHENIDRALAPTN